MRAEKKGEIKVMKTGKLLMAVIVGLLLTGCGKEKMPSHDVQTEKESMSLTEMAGESEATETEQLTKTSETEALAEAPDYREAYSEVVKQYFYECGDYNWQYGLDYADGMAKAVREQTPYAVTDITGDDVPELFMMCRNRDNTYCANLNIYTLGEDGRAKQIYSREWDVQAAGGSVYYLFKGMDDVCYGYYSIADESEDAYYCSFDCDKDGNLQTSKLLTLYEYPNEDYTDRIGEYTANGKNVSKEEYDAQAKQLVDGMKQMILYNDNYGPELLVNKLDTVECISMTQGAIMRHLLVTEPSGAQTLPFSGSLTLGFSSGAGAWGTELTLYPDGTFTGAYHDSNMGESGEGYQATVYVSEFAGKFTDIQKKDDNTYTMKLEHCNTEKPAGEEWIDGDQVRYVASEPYGIEGGTTFEFYLPDAPVASLSEEYVSWIFGLSQKTALPMFGLYNVEAQSGFSGY